MEPTFNLSQTTDKKAAYEEFLRGYVPFISDETCFISVLANTSAALKEAFDFFWVGFYIVEGNELKLGPFQGNVACYSIKEGKGVCGTAMQNKQTQIVPDVDKFPGHIACSSMSRSEIVVPLFDEDNNVIAVLDIDSDSLDSFDNIDKIYLEKIAELISCANKNK